MPQQLFEATYPAPGDPGIAQDLDADCPSVTADPRPAADPPDPALISREDSSA